MPPLVVDPGLALIAAGFFGVLTSMVTIFGTQWAKSKDRDDDRKDREQARAERAQLASDVKDVKRTGAATHVIVNNQRTVMLRAIAILARRLANDHPEDAELAKAAADAERDLRENEIANANPESQLAGA